MTRSESWRRRLRTEATMVHVRWAAVLFALVQVCTYYLPYPAAVLPAAFGVVAGLAIGNAGLALWLRQVGDPAEARRFSLVALVFDIVVVMALVIVYTFDPDTAMFALVYVLPLVGAIRFQRAGALWAMTAATGVYTLREIYGHVAFGNPLLATSISFRMGIGYIIAVVAGAMASSLVRERDDLEVATVQLQEQAEVLRRQANALEQANADLQAANQVKDDFLAMTNHELRTPLTTILGYATTLERRWQEVGDARKRDYLRRIGEQGRRLLSLVEDLLSLSTGTARVISPQVVNVRAAIGEACEALSWGEELSVDAPDHLAVLADHRRFVQILVNYLSNARKYGEPPITVRAWQVDSAVHVCVADSGPGVPADFVPELFDRFTQASIGATRTAEGTGLGLAIVRDLARSQGGEAWYEPGDPTGARFIVALPAAPSSDGGDEPPGRRLGGSSAGGRTEGARTSLVDSEKLR